MKIIDEKSSESISGANESLIINLIKAKEDMLDSRSPETSKAFAQTFAQFVNRGEWAYIPVEHNKNGYLMKILVYQENHYVVVFLDPKQSRSQSTTNIIWADINKVIDAIYSNPHIDGLVFDPYIAPVYISRKQIDRLTDRKDPRQRKRDWGKGIPMYTQDDLMVQEELLDFGIQIVAQYGLQKDGYHILESHNGLGFTPNIVAEKEGNTYFVVVDSKIAPRSPTLDENKKVQLTEYAHKLHGKCLYASVQIFSVDDERCAASLALCGDGFYATFKGLEEIALEK